MATWGKFGSSLDDVAILIFLQLVSDAQAIGMTLEGEDKKRLDFLNKSLFDSSYAANKSTYLSWAKFFEEGEGRNKISGRGSLGYWLSYFLFPSCLEVDYIAIFFF